MTGVRTNDACHFPRRRQGGSPRDKLRVSLVLDLRVRKADGWHGTEPYFHIHTTQFQQTSPTGRNMQGNLFAYYMWLLRWLFLYGVWLFEDLLEVHKASRTLYGLIPTNCEII